MPTPIDSLRFVHAAILAEGARVDDLIHGPLDAAGARALAADVEFFADLVHKHTHGEEVGLFPRLAEREAHFAETYLHDHEEERARFRRVGELLAAMAGGADVLAELRRESTALRAHATAHVTKENQLVLPYVATAFDVPAQAAILQAILATIPPADMARVVPWIVERVDADTACAYVNVLAGVMPPPAFTAARGWIRERCSPARVALLQERVPSFT